MVLNNIITRILERANRSGDTTLDNAITYSLETVQDEIINKITFPELLELDETALLLVADTQTYSLPDDFDQMIQIWDTASYNQELKRISGIEYKIHLGDVTGGHGTPIYYDIIDSLAVSSTYRKRIKFFPYPETITNGIIATFANNTGVPASFTNYNSTKSGAVLIADTAHGLETGMRVVIAGTANYNGTFTVYKVDINNFYIIATYVAEAGGGTWTCVGTDITDVSHGLTTGNSITISGTTNYNGVVSVIVKDADTFYISTAYVAEVGALTKTWILNKYIPFIYMKSLAYLSSSNAENALSYMYPQLYIEGGLYYLFRDYIYRDQPEKIAFRKAEFRDVIEQVKSAVSQPDYVRSVLPKRLLSSIVTSNRLYRTQYQGYTS
ncbi:MAG: hypothetical protein V1709_04310 [Planctomycetota bacterium]